jgi:hypothetical protein
VWELCYAIEGVLAFLCGHDRDRWYHPGLIVLEDREFAIIGVMVPLALDMFHSMIGLDRLIGCLAEVLLLGILRLQTRWVHVGMIL